MNYPADRRRFLTLAGIAALLGLTCYIQWPTPNETQSIIRPKEGMQTSTIKSDGTPPQPTPITTHQFKKQESRAAILKQMSNMLLTPITFYGKVIDQHGNSVPNADVGYGLLDKFLASGSTGRAIADENGKIRISGVRGAVITVGVSKPGYYGVDGKSALSFAYGTPPDDYRLPPPTAESPAIFLLHKRGVAAPLLHVKKRNHNVPRDGTPVRIELATGQVSPTGELKVEAWTQEREPNAPRFYEWKCRISIPGGGILERKDSLQFEAPLQGLASYDEIAYTNERHLWNSRFEKEYFVRLPDNTFGRIEVYFTTGGDHFVSVESLLNPKAGDRNLEFDENNQWQP